MSNNDRDPTLVAGFAPGGPVYRSQNTPDGPRYLSRGEAFREQQEQRVAWGHYVALQDRKEQARRDAQRAYHQKAWQLEAEHARRKRELDQIRAKEEQEEQELKKKKIGEFQQRIADLVRREKISQSDALLLWFLFYFGVRRVEECLRSIYDKR